MTEEPNAKQANKPNAASKQQQAVHELLEKLGIPTQPTGCAADSAGGVSVGCGRAGDVPNQHSEGVAGVGSASQTNVVNQQLAAPAEATAQPGGGGSVVVDCRYCGGCCGGLQGRRLPAGVVELIQLVEEKLGLRYECEVVNKYPELFCRRLGRRRRRVASVKEFERLLSREVEYKASYVLVRLNECHHDAVCWRYLRLGVEGWLDAVYRLAGREPTVNVDDYVGRLARGLGFRGVVDLARYLKFLVQFLMDFNYVNRGRGFHDVLSARCRICGRVINATGPLPGVLFTIVNHFRVKHGLKAISDVETKVKEIEEHEASRFEGDDVVAKVHRNSADAELLFRRIAHRLVDVRLFERIGKSYRCLRCNNDVGDAVDAVFHVLRHHYDAFDKLLGGKPIPSAKGINDAVDELASLFNSSNPDGVKPVVKALVQGIIDVLNVKGTISIPMLTRWLSEDDDYRLLLNSLTTGSLQTDRVVVMIVETMARHGLVHIEGEVVKAGD
ncbi:MAG: hypothetical protein RQ838_03595 [Caldivirga sp.]|nr:hypothetical protein [Caldivirga sp.]